MAENHEELKPKEREIPVFTVLKNNCMLKNIFLLDNPPPFSPSAENAAQDSVMEEVLLVGRHPDCNIKLEHPSISRFHLRIHSKPSSRSLSVTDLSSVHGTWISGKKIEPGVMIKLNEGDTLHLGASSRLYRLNWVPVACAYDIDNPFVPQLDGDDTVEEQKDGAMDQDENRNDPMQTLSDNMEGLELLFSDEGPDFCMEKRGPISPLMLEDNSSPEIYDQENEFEKASTTPEACFPLEPTETSELNSKKQSGLSIWSRRGKPESVQIETGRSKGNCARIDRNLQVELFGDENFRSESVLEDNYLSPGIDKEIFTPDKENQSPKSLLVMSMKSKGEETFNDESATNSPIFSLDQDDEEIFTPDKENMTPDSRVLRSIKNSGKLGKVKHQLSYKSSPLKRANNSNTYQEEEHQNVLQEHKVTNSASQNHGSLLKKRDPFHPLPVISTSSSRSNSKTTFHEETMRERKSIKYPEPEDLNQSFNNHVKVERKQWVIVVDTTCLLNKKSRKELQLLRGLRGTTLVIPRIVVRELDCMVKRARFYARTTEISAALQWIEESMEVAKWWIHVQNSAEEGRLIPATPPAASPHFFNEENLALCVGPVPFSPHSLQEIVTPTAGDHILECALYLKRTRNDAHLALLSDDLSLKIKAMAEGLICETAEEFRRSLVNPFSKRFLYANSSPIGPTWSCKDDLVLKEKYYPSPSKKIPKSVEGVKGLKLILLHNSSFRPITPAG